MAQIMMPVEAVDDACKNCPFLDIEIDMIEIWADGKIVSHMNCLRCKWAECEYQIGRYSNKKIYRCKIYRCTRNKHGAI